MSNLKEVRNRINSIVSTQQITKAMKMVAAAKLRRAQDAITKLRPYSNKLSGILSNLQAASSESFNTPYSQEREIKSVLIVVVTSDRGLCGAFNANVVKGAIALAKDKYVGQNIEFLCVGKKGSESLKRLGYNVNNRYTELFHELDFAHARKAAEYAMDSFVQGKFDEVVVVYNEFKNVITQILRIETLLPIAKPAATTSNNNTDYIFEPSVEYIVNEVVPQAIKLQFYKALLDSNAAEQGARMSAMDKATENAGEILKDLRLEYNRTRQALITKEITEIVGGAAAL
jgi:F-type H+-transporting ATPase subunit gamma